MSQEGVNYPVEEDMLMQDENDLKLRESPIGGNIPD